MQIKLFMLSRSPKLWSSLFMSTTPIFLRIVLLVEKHYPLFIRFWYKYSKSHVRECISWQIGASDYLEVFVISRIFRECNLKPLTASRETINHELHEQKQIRSHKCMKCTRSDLIHFSLLLKWQLREKKPLFEIITTLMYERLKANGEK